MISEMFDFDLRASLAPPNHLYVKSGWGTVAPLWPTVCGVGEYFSPPLVGLPDTASQSACRPKGGAKLGQPRSVDSLVGNPKVHSNGGRGGINFVFWRSFEPSKQPNSECGRIAPLGRTNARCF